MIAQPSPNHQPRPGSGVIDMLVLHYTGMKSGRAARARLCDPASGVSAHYLVEEDGTVFALVEEARRAWHAGISFWRGCTDINSRSIGIELVNPGHEFGYRAFPTAQMDSLVALTQGILARHPIPPRNVVGHSDIAPARKTDPGELFDWQGLAAQGIGVWPPVGPAPMSPQGDLAAMLARLGYDVQPLQPALVAFQRHFRPTCHDGQADAETLSILSRLLEIIGEH